MQLRLVTILLSNGVKYFKSVANQQDCRNILCIVLLLDANFIIDNVIDSRKFKLKLATIDRYIRAQSILWIWQQWVKVQQH